MTKHCCLNVFIIATFFQCTAFASLLDDLKSLSVSDDKEAQAELIKSILLEKNFEEIPSFKLTRMQIDEIFKRLQAHKTPYEEKFFYPLFLAYKQAGGAIVSRHFLDALLMSSNAKEVKKFSDDNSGFLSFLLGRDLNYYLATREAFNTLQRALTILLLPKNKAILLEKILNSPSAITVDKMLLQSSNNLKKDLSVAQQNIFSHVVNNQNSWLDQAELLITFLETTGLKNENIRTQILHMIENDELKKFSESDFTDVKKQDFEWLLKESENVDAARAQKILLGRILKNSDDVVARWLRLDSLEPYLKSSDTSADALKIKKAILNALLPQTYKDEMRTFSKMIFPDIFSTEEREKFAYPKPDYRVVCNQTGYDEGENFSCTGKKITLDDGTPVGYNAHIPPGEVRGVFTHVYGGTKKSDRKEGLFRPGVLTDLDHYLLANRFAVVTLNLADLLELDVYQLQLSSELHARLHAGIHRAFDAMKYGTIDEALSDKPNFLFGASFGGRTAVKHAELSTQYRRTFAGYISFNGALDFEEHAKTASAIRGDDTFYRNPVADPAYKIGDIVAPILLLHNVDDNNVNVAVTLSWYRKAMDILKPLGADHLIRLLITMRGNPIPANAAEIHNKGHYLPTDKDAFLRLAQHILRFMTDGPSSLPAVSELSATTFHLFAYRMIMKSNLSERFFSEAFRRYYLHKASPQNDNVWESDYLPIAKSLFFVEQFTTDDQVKNELERLRNSTSFEAKEIDRVLLLHALSFANYLIEKRGWNIKAEVIAEILQNNDDVKDSLFFMETTDATLNRYLLRQIYLANPQFVDEVITEEKKIELNGIAEKLRKDFVAKLSEIQKLAEKSWSQAAGALAVLKLHEERTTAVSKFKSLLDKIIAARKSVDENQFVELMLYADQLLNNLRTRIAVRSHYRALRDRFDACKSTTCATEFRMSSLSLALVLAHRETMDETIKSLTTMTDGNINTVVDDLELLSTPLRDENKPFTTKDLQQMRTPR